jgi:predicted RNase H-like HicB family nuclease
MQSAKDYLQQPYARIVIPVEPSSFHAEILEFPGCFAQGETVEEAYTNLENAAESWIESCLSHGQEIPEPSSSLTYSGRVALRLPRNIHRKASQMAERDETSLNTYLVSAVSAKVGAEDFYNVLAQRLEQRLTTTVSTLAQAFYTWTTQLSEQQTSINIDIRSIKPEKTVHTISAHAAVKNGGR